MTVTIIILSLLLAVQTVRVWVLKRQKDKAQRLAREMYDLYNDEHKTVEALKAINKGLLGEVKCEEWPEIIG